MPKFWAPPWSMDPVVVVILPPYAGGYAQILGTPMACSTVAIVIAMAKQALVDADYV
jgi:hypothetical protein